jgi:predicted HTH domain antitoxin
MVIIEDKYLKAADLEEGELKTEIAIMLFQQERLSLRKAAELVGVHWLEFMKLLNRREISLHYDESLL